MSLFTFHVKHTDPNVDKRINRIEKKLNLIIRFIILQGTVMARELEDLDTKATSLGKVAGNVGNQLYELKAALDTAVLNNNMGAVQAISDKLGVIRDGLIAAGRATDITPETPVDDEGNPVTMVDPVWDNPDTGAPYDVDPASGLPIDPSTGGPFATDPVTGAAFDIDPATNKPRQVPETTASTARASTKRRR